MNASYRLFELQSKDIINVCDGRNVGRITDVEIDGITGTVTRMIVPGKPKYFGIFGRGEDVYIPWQKIKLIGVDSILIDYPEISSAGEHYAKNNIWSKIFE